MASGQEGLPEGKPVTLAVVKAILSKREKEGELHYEQKLALEYSKKFSRVDEKEAQEIIDALAKLEIPRFKERHAVKLIDVLPEDRTGVKAIFSKESISPNNEQTDAILKVLGKYRKSQPKGK
ncbi:MAG: RNA polymerase Rpb4 family protein [archaeon]